MKQRLKNILRDTDTHAALVLSVVAALLWQVYSPRFSDDVTHHVIGRGGRALTQRMSIPMAIVEDFRFERVGGKTPSNMIFEMGGTISLPESGYYTFKAVLEHSIPGPLRFDVNDRTVTHAALYGLTEQSGRGAKTYVLARNVHLNAGSNRISLTGNNLRAKAIVLTTKRQASPGILRFAGRVVLFFVIVSPVIAALRVSTRSPRSRLAAVLLLTVLATSLPITILYHLRGERLAHLGVSMPYLNYSLQVFETRLEAVHRESQGSGLSVCIFGDSTHFAGDTTMMEELTAHLSDRGVRPVDVYGLAHPALGMRAYYLLANRIVSERPDVLIIPVNLPTFQNKWLTNPSWGFAVLERYLKPSEIPKVLPLRVGNRTFKWEHIVLKKLDFAWFEGRGENFIEGARSYRSLEEKRLSDGMVNWLAARRSTKTPPPRPIWIPSPGPEDQFIVEPDNQLFPLADALSALCEKYGVHVLYYTVPVHRFMKEKYRADENYEFIRDRLSGPSHVTVLDLSNEFPVSIFRDRVVHLNPAGISTVAERLAQEVRRIQAGQDSAPANSDSTASQR